MKKYIHAGTIALKQMKEFFVNFIGQIVYFPIKFAIIFLLWKYVYSSMSGEDGYTFEEMIGYYFIFSVIEAALMTSSSVTYEEWEIINSGELNMYLTRPISYPVYAYAQKAGEFLVNTVIGIFFVYLSALCMRVFFDVDIVLTHPAVFFIALFFGFTIMVNLFQIIGHVTFWVENVLSLRDNLWNVIRIFSGAIFPVAMYPPILQKLCGILPFQYIYYVPVSIFQNKIRGQEMWDYLVFQMIWCFGLISLNAVLWMRGSKKYAGQGG